MEKVKNHFYIDDSAVVESGVTIYPNSFIIGNSKIFKGAIIYPNSVIKDSIIGSGCIVKSSYIECSELKSNVVVGPYANIRPNCVIGQNCRIGNFVEIKSSYIDSNTKIAHLAYVGDADIGKNCNIGCGVIFANYNGKIKSKTIIKNNCFIGSNCNLIAPLSIEDNCFVCAGTTITKNLKKGDFVIGRMREIIKNNRAKQYLKEYYE